MYIVSHPSLSGLGLIFFSLPLYTVCTRSGLGLDTVCPRSPGTRCFRGFGSHCSRGLCTRSVHGLYSVCPCSPGTLRFRGSGFFVSWRLNTVWTRSGFSLDSVWTPSVRAHLPLCVLVAQAHLFSLWPLYTVSTRWTRSVFSAFINRMCSDPLASCGFWIEYLVPLGAHRGVSCFPPLG